MIPLILVVDDKSHISQIMCRSLKNAGYDVDTARDGEEAMRKIDTAIPDVLIADMQMPDMDGQTLYECIERKYPARVGLAVLVSANTSKKLRTWARSRKNTKYMEKPVSQRRLVEHVNAHFETLPLVG